MPLGANFSRFRLARLQAESSRNMYSLHGLLALMRAVFFEVCQRLTVVSYCMPGSPQCQVASEILWSRSLALKVCIGRPSLHGARGEVVVAQDGVHEVVGDADGVVGVLEEDGGVGFGVGRRPSYPACDRARGPWLLLSTCTR